jgi:hypothetical protein
MAKAHPPEKLASNIFLLSIGGILVWIAAAFAFVILP